MKANGPTDVPSEHAEQVTENVMRQGDKYRWIYDVNLWKDTILPVMVFKVILLAALVPALIVFAVTAFEGNPGEGLRLFIQVYAITAGVMIALFIIAYPIYILIKGGRYSILFEMDDRGINHIEMPRTVKRSDLMGWVSFAAGVVAGHPGLLCSGSGGGARKEGKKMNKVGRLTSGMKGVILL